MKPTDTASLSSRSSRWGEAVRPRRIASGGSPPSLYKTIGVKPADTASLSSRSSGWCEVVRPRRIASGGSPPSLYKTIGDETYRYGEPVEPFQQVV